MRAASTMRKMAANRKVAQAIASGRLVRPDCCSRCGRQSKRIEGHHEDYRFPLRVVWLCTLCHRARHMEIRALKNERKYGNGRVVEVMERVLARLNKGAA